MSKIFFDHLIEVEEIKLYIDRVTQTHDEKEDLWNLVDEYINHRIISSILSGLDEGSHEEFLSMFLEKPYDPGIINYLDTRLTVTLDELVDKNLQEIINELNEILEIQPSAGNAVKSIKKKRNRK